MQLRVRRAGEVTILELTGGLTANDDLGALKQKVASLLLTGHKAIVFNLDEVTSVDSSGLGELVACHATAWRGGATVRLVNGSARLQDLLLRTRLLRIFEAYNSEAEALESFPVLA
jgi:anti-anti-sigma factor